MLTDTLQYRSCLASARRWRQEAANLRAHAGRVHLRPEQRAALLREAEACDRQADWWINGANEYLPATSTCQLEGLLP